MDKIERPDLELYKSLSASVLAYLSNVEIENIDKPDTETYFSLSASVFAYVSILEAQNEAMRQTLTDWNILINKERERNNDLINKIIEAKTQNNNNQPGSYTEFIKIDVPGQIKINE